MTTIAYSFRELWVHVVADKEWRCAGRLEEPAQLLTNIWTQGVAEMVLMKIQEDDHGNGTAECLWQNCEHLSDEEKTAILTAIAESRDNDILGIVPPPVPR